MMKPVSEQRAELTLVKTSTVELYLRLWFTGDQTEMERGNRVFRLQISGGEVTEGRRGSGADPVPGILKPHTDTDRQERKGRTEEDRETAENERRLHK